MSIGLRRISGKDLLGFLEDNLRLRPNFLAYLGVRCYFQNCFHDDRDNFAPRLSFAYAPSPGRKTVIRGGAGIFHDRTGPGPIGDLLHFNGINRLRFLLNSNVPHPVQSADLSGIPTSIATLDPGPHSLPPPVQYRRRAAGDREDHVESGARRQQGHRPVSIGANAPLPGSPMRPNPGFGPSAQMQSDGYLKSNALELTFRGKLNKYFSGQAQYTLSRTDNNTGGIAFFPADSHNPAADRG